MDNKLIEDLLKRLSARTIKYFNNDLAISCNSDFKIEQVDVINCLDITSFITLNGSVSGIVGMSVSKHFAKDMAKCFLFGDPTEEEVEEVSLECVSETLNVTLGNILHELDAIKDGGSVDISTPYTMHNSVIITKRKDGIMYLVDLMVQDSKVLLTYFK